MTEKDFHNLDNELKDLVLSYRDIDVTYLVRNHLISLIRTKGGVGNSEIVLSSNILLRFLISAFKTIPFLFKKRKVWVFSNAERRKKIDTSFFYDRVASIVSEDSTDALFIENPVLQDHKFPTKDSVLSEGFFFICAFFFGLFFFKKRDLKLDDRLFDIVNKYEISPNITSVIKRFVSQYYLMNFFLKYIHKPEKVFVVYPNGYNGYVLAFKKFAIPIIELQHGIIYPLHPSYNTVLGNKANLFKPDYIYTYGEKDKECLEELNYIDADKIEVVGSYGLWKSKQENFVGNYLKSKISDTNKTIVVVATVNDIHELYEFCLELQEKIDGYTYLLLPRHHTLEFKDTSVVKVLDASQTNIFETYQIADILITKSSSSALESLFMEIPTFIYEPNGLSIFRKNYGFINSFNYVSSANEFEKVLENNNSILPTKNDVEQIFALDVMSNFKEANSKF